jgi:alkylhydroperoxidase family enzyme
MPLINVDPSSDSSAGAGPLFSAGIEDSSVSNSALLFQGRPQIFAAWRALQRSVQSRLAPRRGELVAFAAALALKSTYAARACAVSLARFFSPAELEALALDYHRASLDTVEVAVMDFAQKIAQQAWRVNPSDIQWLRSLGVGDAEIADIVFAAAAQGFICKVVDGLGAEPDQPQRSLDPDLRAILTLGRNFD